MCGIVGIASSKPVDSRSWLAKSVDQIAHRGPDDRGEWWSADSKVGLGHRRLAILDPSMDGHQPMQVTDGSMSIVYNGELYNFRALKEELSTKGINFHTNCDTEVLLAAYSTWGEDCLSRLEGMFAFAIYDSSSRTLFAARDRAGEKPFFYYFSNKSLRFASELKALLADPEMPRQISHSALDCFLFMGFVPGSGCILEGYRKLPPAHALRFDVPSGELKVWRYWQIPRFSLTEQSPEKVDDKQLLSELESTLENAVRKQLISDVPVGILLSGGVDSSLVTAMAARSSEKLRTFTVRFPGAEKYDETSHARLIAKAFRTDHTELDAQTVTADILPLIARQYDEPIIDSSAIPTYLVSKLVRDYCTVALGGDGGDELFGGYTHYSRLLALRKFAGSPIALPLAAATRWISALLPPGTRTANWAYCWEDVIRSKVPAVAAYFRMANRSKLFANNLTFSPRERAEEIRLRNITTGGDLTYNCLASDFYNYLPDNILVKTDRASMLNSLEIRAPFLDRSLIEFAFGRVRSELKAIANKRKILLKNLARRVLPQEFDFTRKQGFSIPLNEWVRAGSFRDMFHETLLKSDTIFNRNYLKSLLEWQDKGFDNGERLFGLVIFELWRKEYGVEL